MSNTAVKEITSLTALRAWLRQMETRRVSTFTFRPKGTLLSQYPTGSMGTVVLDMMPLTNRAQSSIRKSGGNVDVTCTVTYRPCVRMLDAWQGSSRAPLEQDELRALEIARDDVLRVMKMRSTQIDRLYLLYTYIGAKINYQKGKVRTPEFAALTSAAAALLTNKANCQGFAEVMYLMVGMMGYEAGIMSGRSGAGPHSWNYVTIDGAVYAMDASSSAVARAASAVSFGEYACFLMGKREAQENRLVWTNIQENVKLAPRLPADLDFYQNQGYSVTTVERAARIAWQRRIAGDRVVHIRIRAQVKVTASQVTKALSECAKAPAVQRAIATRMGGSSSYRVVSSGGDQATFVMIEWPEK
ncbi:MAG: hypothetical protein IJ343_01300 [Clostridia bacterium]|nr:hypothetical protein [Clostridia bacterium]